jgi:transcriptional regulator with XRE-family HTH domain
MSCYDAPRFGYRNQSDCWCAHHRISQTQKYFADRLGGGDGLQKYDKGSNRINAARLQAIANYLDVPICDLYGNENGSFSRDENIKFISLPGAIDLLKAFAEIESMEMRRNVLAIAHTAARISVGATATDA